MHLAGIESNKVVECSRQVKIVPDQSLGEILEGVRLSFTLTKKDTAFDVIVLPGGMAGARAFQNVHKLRILFCSLKAYNVFSRN